MKSASGCSVEDLQSSIEALKAAHSEAQAILMDEFDRAALLVGVVAQVRGMVEQWAIDGCKTETSKDLAQLILAAITSQAPETATLLSEHPALIGFIPEAYKTALSANVSLEEAQDVALREILSQREPQSIPGSVQ